MTIKMYDNPCRIYLEKDEHQGVWLRLSKTIDTYYLEVQYLGQESITNEFTELWEALDSMTNIVKTLTKDISGGVQHGQENS